MGICIRPVTAMRSLYVLWLYCKHACKLYDNFCMTTAGIFRSTQLTLSMCTLLLSLLLYRQLYRGSRGGGRGCTIMMIQGIPPVHCLGQSCAHWWCWCCRLHNSDVVDDILRPSSPQLLSNIVFMINCTFSSRGLTMHGPHS